MSCSPATVLVVDANPAMLESTVGVVLPYVFEQFRPGEFGTARRQSGLGVGLAIAKQLAEMHGGTIRAASNGEGKGAEFVVTLPLPPV